MTGNSPPGNKRNKTPETNPKPIYHTKPIGKDQQAEHNLQLKTINKKGTGSQNQKRVGEQAPTSQSRKTQNTEQHNIGANQHQTQSATCNKDSKPQETTVNKSSLEASTANRHPKNQRG